MSLSPSEPLPAKFPKGMIGTGDGFPVGAPKRRGDGGAEATGQAAEETGSQSLDAAVFACLAEELGADITAVVASGAIPLTEA